MTITKLILNKRDIRALTIIDVSKPHLVSLFHEIINSIGKFHHRMIIIVIFYLQFVTKRLKVVILKFTTLY